MFIYTRHALEKIDADGLEREEIESVIKKGVKWKEDNREIWHANMNEIKAVFAKNEQNLVVITAYAARRENVL